MDTRSFDILPEMEVPKLPEANFYKKIPDNFVGLLQGMNRKQRREWYKKNKPLLKEATNER